MMPNLKTHFQGIRKVFYAYFLAVALSWAAFPIIVVALSQYAQIYVVLSVYTFIVTIVFICILYLMMHGFGETDRKPYVWARYNMKGFVCGFAAFIGIILLEQIIILLADKYIIVRHPYFTIASLNHYAKLILYMPFFWLYRMISPPTQESIIPQVTPLTSILPIVVVTGVAGIGYIMGFHGIRIVKNPPKNEFIRKFLYGGPKKKKKMKPPPKEDAR